MLRELAKHLAAEEELGPWATAQGTVLDRITLSGTLATNLKTSLHILQKQFRRGHCVLTPEPGRGPAECVTTVTG
jgi:hypothetical protein